MTMEPQAPIQSVRLPVEGGHLHVRIQGRGEPVLLVHGIFASGYCWRQVAERLAAHYAVYTVDLLGFGESDMPADGDYSQSAQARRLHQVIAGLGLRDVRLVGHSMGGEISVHAVLLDPTPFKQLVLVAADGFRRPFRRWQRELLSGAWMSWLVRHTFDERHFRHSIRTIVKDPHVFTPEMIAGYCQPYHRREFPEAMRRVAKDREGGFTPETCSALRLPVLLLWGENDHIVPKRIGDRYHAAIPHSVYRTRPKCGHLPMEEHPDWVLDELLTFFQ